MSKTFRTSSTLYRHGGGFYGTEGFKVSFSPDDFFDQVSIVDASKHGNTKISMSLEEAEWLVQFIRQAKESYKLWKYNHEDDSRLGMDDAESV